MLRNTKAYNEEIVTYVPIYERRNSGKAYSANPLSELDRAFRNSLFVNGKNCT